MQPTLKNNTKRTNVKFFSRTRAAYLHLMLQTCLLLYDFIMKTFWWYLFTYTSWATVCAVHLFYSVQTLHIIPTPLPAKSVNIRRLCSGSCDPVSAFSKWLLSAASVHGLLHSTYYLLHITSSDEIVNCRVIQVCFCSGVLLSCKTTSWPTAVEANVMMLLCVIGLSMN